MAFLHLWLQGMLVNQIVSTVRAKKGSHNQMKSTFLKFFIQCMMTAAWGPLWSCYLYNTMSAYGHICCTQKNKVCSYVRININYVFVSAAMQKRSVLSTVCLTALSLSVCVEVYVRMFPCVMEGEEELGLGRLDQHHSDWEDPVLLSWPHM